VSTVLEQVLARIGPADVSAREEAARALDAKTKPRGSLGRLEEVAQRIAAIRHDAHPGRLRAAVVVAAADHGVAAEGVSAYPQEVTRQMLANFESGGAAVCVLARLAGATLRVIDAGVGSPTGNIATGPAMSRDQAVERIEKGIAVADELAHEGVAVLALGEMGIGNSTPAAAVSAALLQTEPRLVCGRGTGIDDAGFARKVAAVERALAVNDVRQDDPLAVLAALGGFELAVLCGVALGAAANRQVVVLDGFIATAAALVASGLAPGSVEAMIAAHVSPEPGHRLALEALAIEPLLDLGLRLGEGSGAALALPLLDASLAILGEMATFDAAGVTDAGR
jgi:nicotinate-nucleotide--dimethylbenzimidazole phosphoribosyltransferase